MRRLRRTLLAAALVALVGLVPAAYPVAGLTFTAKVDNRWFPLQPGTTYVYRGSKDGSPARDVFAVT